MCACDECAFKKVLASFSPSPKEKRPHLNDSSSSSDSKALPVTLSLLHLAGD